MGIRQRRDSGKVIHSTRDRAGHQVTPGHRASASMQRVEAVMVTAQLVAIRCHKKRLIC